MYDILSAYEGIVTPTALEAIVNTEHIFQEYGYVSHQLSLQELTALPDVENEGKGTLLYSLYMDHATSVVASFGVKLTQVESLSLNTVSTILGGLISLDEPDNIDIIENCLLEGSDDSIFIIAEMLAELTVIKKTDYFSLIVEVDPSLVSLLASKSTEPDIQESVIFETSKLRAEYLEFEGERREGIVYDMIRQADRLPISWTSVELALSEKNVEIGTRKEIAREIYAGLIVSGIKPTDRLQKGLEFREETFPTGFDKVDAFLRELTAGVENE